MNIRMNSQTLGAGAGTDNTLASHTTGLSVGYMEEFRRERNVALTRVYGHVQRGERCLVVPMGGGGDCMGASLVAYDLMRSFGAKVLMLGLTLKRPSQTNTRTPQKLERPIIPEAIEILITSLRRTFLRCGWNSQPFPSSITD
jgi:hypothetical protein